MQSAMAKTSYLTLRAVMSAWIAEVLTVKEQGIALSDVFKPAILNTTPSLSLWDGLYLNGSSRMTNSLPTTTVQSLRRRHILVITDIGARLRIAQSSTFLPSGSGITTDPLISFQMRVVVEALRGFPQQVVLQDYCLTAATH